MDRFGAVKKIFHSVKEKDVVISSCGYISREVYHYQDRPLNFYMQGSMGCALAFGIGVALFKDTDVHVIQGDGSLLMSLGTSVLLKSLDLKNLRHYVIDNNSHESTGGQRTVSDHIDFFCFERFIVEKSSVVPPRIKLSCPEITKRFRNALKSIDDKVKPQIP